ncbi:MAG: hypothetical protein JOY66_06465, partial [Acetobacteraceae bacterium]|nr:hypothetical protein [Acetobacteraceae bacterium]
MDIDTIAGQIRALCPIFNNNVAGAAAYANAVADETFLALPSAYVIPHGSDADENTSENGLWQTVNERVAVIIVIQTLMAGGQLDLADRRAQAAAASIDT